jgi:hypothetical protein
MLTMVALRVLAVADVMAAMLGVVLFRLAMAALGLVGVVMALWLGFVVMVARLDVVAVDVRPDRGDRRDYDRRGVW